MSEKQNISNASMSRKQITRRRFIASAGAAALSFTIIKPSLVRGTQANSKIKLGMIGCGNRGTWIASLFLNHGGYEIVSAADYFQENVDVFGDKFKVEKSRRYSSLTCYKALLHGGVDAVAIESPPYFHPEQAAAAVNAGCHVYLAKPIAVDVPGCSSVAESSKKATSNNQCFLVDFQTRTHEFYREAVKRVQYGEIGRIVCGEASYHCGLTWERLYKFLQDTPVDPENRLRAWGVDRALSGDVITEQNIHALDVATWILDEQPIKAYGTGGRNRTIGNCWDHFSVIYTFPKDVIVTFNSKQFGQGYGDILCRMYGTSGTIDTHYFGEVTIRGNMPYKGGHVGNLYTDGAKKNMTDFYDNILHNRFSNTTVAQSVRSNLTTILGRTASYNRREVTWDEMIKGNEKLEANLQGLKA